MVEQSLSEIDTVHHSQTFARCADLLGSLVTAAAAAAAAAAAGDTGCKATKLR